MQTEPIVLFLHNTKFLYCGEQHI